MRNVLMAYCLQLVVHAVYSQGVGIGTSEVDGNAILELRSVDKGLLLPRVNNDNVPGAAPNGTLLYNTTTNVLNVKQGNAWVALHPVPAGGIIMWNGTTAPAGWALCDGSNGTPDLRSRFIVGYDPRNAAYDGVGKTGGAASVQLGLSNIPSHSHELDLNTRTDTHSHNVRDEYARENLPAGAIRLGQQSYGRNNRNVTWGYQTRTTSSDTHSHAIDGSTETTGGNAAGVTVAHENRPPYYTLAFIMKL